MSYYYYWHLLSACLGLLNRHIFSGHRQRKQVIILISYVSPSQLVLKYKLKYLLLGDYGAPQLVRACMGIIWLSRYMAN